MFDLNRFLQKLDRIYAQGGAEEAEAWLHSGIVQAQQEEEWESVLTILNELIGFYRTTTRFEEYRIATLYHNMGLLSLETGSMRAAHQEIQKSLWILLQHPEEEVAEELATGHTNLGTVLLRMHRYSEAISEMRLAVRLFERHKNTKGQHYAAALSGLAEAAFYKGDLPEAKNLYQQSMSITEQFLGRTGDYEKLKDNYSLVQNLLDRQISYQNIGDCAQGLMLSEDYKNFRAGMVTVSTCS